MHHRPRLPLLRLFRRRTETRSLRWGRGPVPWSPPAARDAGAAAGRLSKTCSGGRPLLDRPRPRWPAWQSLGGAGRPAWAQYLQRTRELYIRTPAGTDLRVGRGRGASGSTVPARRNFPDGEVFNRPRWRGTHRGHRLFSSGRWVYAGREGCRAFACFSRPGAWAEASAETRGKSLLLGPA